jgi:hypothetical protein
MGWRFSQTHASSSNWWISLSVTITPLAAKGSKPVNECTGLMDGCAASVTLMLTFKLQGGDEGNLLGDKVKLLAPA